MERFLNIAWSGIWIGSLYGVIGAALVLNYRAGRVVNIAIGQLFVFGALLAWWVQGDWSVPWGVAAAFVAGGLIGGGQDVLILQRLRGASTAIVLLATVGVATALSGFAIVFFGRDPVSGEGLAPNGDFELGVWRASWDALLFVVVVLVAVAAMWVAVTRSASGRAVTASGHDAEAAAMLGINVRMLRLVSMAAAGALTGLAGALFLPLGVIDFSVGLNFTLFGFVAAAVTGYRSLGLALFGGWAIGLIDALGTTYVSSKFGLVFTFTALIVVALVAQSIRSDREVFETV